MPRAKTCRVLSLAAVSLVAVLAFQWPALFAVETSFNTSDDIAPIRAGIAAARVDGYSQWWVGPWPHLRTPFFRPLAALAHVAQTESIDSVGIVPVTLFSMVLFAGICTLTGLLAAQLAQDWRLVYPVAVVAALFHADSRSDWLAYWPFMDNLLCVGFSLLAVVAFVRWMQRPSGWGTAAAWVGIVGACLSKEVGVTTGLVCLVLSVALPTSRRVPVIAQALALAAGAGMIYLYARHVVPRHHPMPLRFSNVWLASLFNGNWWIPALLAIAVTASVGAWMFHAHLCTPLRRAGWLTVSACALGLAMFVSPDEGLPCGQYALVYLVDRAALLSRDAVTLAAGVAVAYWFVTVRARWMIAVVCAAAVVVPLQMAGIGIVSGRVLFVWPWVVLTVAIGAAEGLRHLPKKLATGVSIRSRSYPLINRCSEM